VSMAVAGLWVGEAGACVLRDSVSERPLLL